MKLAAMITTSISVGLVGCASIPKVTVSYYLPKAETAITATQLIDCDSAKTVMTVSTTVNASTAYFSDLARSHKIAFNDLDGTFSDSNMTIVLTDDGRLKSVNATTTGEAEGVAKSAATLAATAAAFGGELTDRKQIADACARIENLGKGKPLSLTYSTSIKYSGTCGADNAMIKEKICVSDKLWPTSKGDDPFTIDPLSKVVYEKLNVPHLAPVLKVISSFDISPLGYKDSASLCLAEKPSGEKDIIPLCLGNTSSFDLRVYQNEQPIWLQKIIAPRDGDYAIPIPKSAAFGQQIFAVSLGDSGAVTSIQYSKNTGTGGAINASNSALSAIKPESPGDHAAQLKAKADEIQQQQRLLSCRKDPSSCS